MQRSTSKRASRQPAQRLAAPHAAPRHPGRVLAAIAGGLATAGALAILLQDGVKTGQWSLDHGLIPVLMLVQILCGHLTFTALRAGWRRLLSAAGFGVVTAVATWAVLYTSIGKQAETAGPRIQAATENAAQRAKTAKMLAEAEYMLAACPTGTPAADIGTKCGLRVRQVAECNGGNGTKCKGVSYSVGVYEAAIEGHKLKLAAPPVANPAQRAERVARLITNAFGGNEQALARTLVEIEPAVYALVFELAALVSFGFAFGHARPVTPSTPSANDNTDHDPPSDKAPLPAKGNTAEVIRWVEAFRARHGRDPQIPELQARFPGTPKTTAWRRCKAA